MKKKRLKKTTPLPPFDKGEYEGQPPTPFKGGIRKKEMSSLLFATGYIGKDCQVERYDIWLDYYLPRLSKLNCDKAVIIDDGSPLEQVVKLGIPIVDANNLPEQLPGKVCWVRFPDNLGRPFRGLIPGWWRSFSFASFIALKYNFDRLVHIESDTYIFCDKLFNKIAETNTHWWSPYSKHYYWPETTIQVIHKKGIEKLFLFWNADKMYWYAYQISNFQYVPEYILPIDEVDKGWLGDRFGEDWCKKVPYGIQFASNMNDISTNRIQHKRQEEKMSWLKNKISELDKNL